MSNWHVPGAISQSAFDVVRTHPPQMMTAMKKHLDVLGYEKPRTVSKKVRKISATVAATLSKCSRPDLSIFTTQDDQVFLF